MAEQYKTNRRQDMKKKLLSILLVAATLLCFGCGGGSSSATNSGNSGGSANNSSDAKQTGDLYGTKKPVSATYTFKRDSYTEGPYPMTFVFNDDGSYVATIDLGITSKKYYFASNGVITKSEKYDVSNQLTDANYFINGVCLKDTLSLYDIYAYNYNMGYVMAEARLTNSILDYDSNGNVTNTGTVTEKWKEDSSSLYGNLVIERDDSGKIIKTSMTESLAGGGTTYVYSDDFIYITGQKGIIKVTYNTHGAVTEAAALNSDGSPMGSYYICTFTYDEYGFLTSAKGAYEGIATIEYTY
jgi:hypothetical protein